MTRPALQRRAEHRLGALDFPGLLQRGGQTIVGLEEARLDPDGTLKGGNRIPPALGLEVELTETDQPLDVIRRVLQSVLGVT